MSEPSKIRPNTFQCPNALVDDDVMSVLTGNETKCYLFIVRKTFGWGKDADRIAKSQIMDATGLGENAVDSCMDTLVSFGLVLRLAENDPNKNHGVLWGLQTDDDKIAWDKLAERKTEMKQKQVKRLEKARAARVAAGGGVVEQPHPGVVQQPHPGVVEQPPQKPLSKGLTSTTATDAPKIENPADPEPQEPAPPKPNIFRVYEQNFGALTPLIADELRDFEKTYPPEWIEYAMREAVLSNARNTKYVLSILKRIDQHGFDSPKPTPSTPARDRPKYPTKQTQSQAEAALAAFVQEG